MLKIQRGLRDNGYYSEWMRTKNGELAAVCVMARENQNKALYAYAYAHSVLTFFRMYDTDNAAMMSGRQFAETILEHVKYAYQKLDITFGSKEEHLLPFIGGCITVKDGGLVSFVIGDGAVNVRMGGKKELLAHSCMSHGGMKNLLISDKKLPLQSVRLAAFEAFDGASLYPLRENAKNKKADAGLSLVKGASARDEEKGLEVFRAVVTGRRHASKGQYCQDFADFRVREDYAAAALSDGAGGGNCSEYGAIMNVDAFLTCCEDNIPLGQFKELLLDSIEQIHERLIKDKPEDAVQAYATMMGVYLRDGRLLCLHIGDGMIYGRRRDGRVECISDAENLYVSNRTFFTIESDADEHLYAKVIEAGDYDRLLMMTDGVYNGYPVSGGSDERAAFIGGIFSESDREDFDETTLARLIDTEQVLRYGDDHSAVLIRLKHKDDE